MAPPPSPSLQLDPTAHDDEQQLALNDELIALFAGMEARRAARGSRTKVSRHAAAAARSRGEWPGMAEASFKLPAQEDAASRAAQHERRERRGRADRRYGAAATDVRETEALCNLLYDRAVREHNPPPWPSVPLR